MPSNRSHSKAKLAVLLSSFLSFLASLQGYFLYVLSSGKIVAIGEFGLDYDRLDFCPADVQKKWFREQFALAEKTQLPLFLVRTFERF